MKMILIGISAATLLSIATSAKAADWQANCKAVQFFATGIMQNRQAGTSMSVVMDIAAKDPAIADAATSLVILAYQKPRYSSEEMQKKAIEDFGNDAYLHCAEAANK